MSTPLYESGNVQLFKANLLHFRFKAVFKQGQFQRQVYFGNTKIKTYVDTHHEKDKEQWYKVHERALERAMDRGDYADPLVLEWKILYSEKTVSEGLEAYVRYLREPMTEDEKIIYSSDDTNPFDE